MLPLRGKPLRDRYVLRLIAVDRALHFLISRALAAAAFLFADNRAALDAEFTRILNDLQGGVGGPMTNSTRGIVHDLRTLFAVSITNLYLAGRCDRRLRGAGGRRGRRPLVRQAVGGVPDVRGDHRLPAARNKTS